MSSSRQSIFREWAMIRAVLGPYRKRAIIVLVLVIIDTALASLGIGLVFPVFQAIIDPVDAGPLLKSLFPPLIQLDPDTRLVALAAATILLFALKAMASMLTTITTNSFLQGLRFYWVARIGEYYLYGPYGQISGKKSGVLLNDWSNETLAATRFFQSSITYFSSTIYVLALFVMGMIIDWRVMLGIMAAGILAALLARRNLFASSARLSKVRVELNQAVTSNMLEDLTHVRDLKFLQAEAARLGQLAEVCNSLAKAVVKAAIFADVPRVIGEFLAIFVLMSFVVVSVTLLKQPPAGMLALMAFFFIAFYRIVSEGSQAMAARVKVLNEAHSVVVLERLLSEVDSREDSGKGLPLPRIETDIVIRDVHYAYDKSNNVLCGVSASIPFGKTTLLVGPSGSGKSTLLDLLMRLEKPSAGAIEVHGQSAAEYNLADWRRQFGYVSQEAALFNGDISSNLRLAKPSALDAELESACRLAGAHDFIQALPMGYMTTVGDRGYSLSGGQRKRIAIARALIRNPAVLVLDEATTSFEQSLEQSMLSAIRSALPDITIVQVTHRLTAQEEVDWVVALHEGRVVAEGRWDAVQPRLAPLFET
jgi:ABC-type bacteriocin/lantibiotic exporter with double-glycine peptidase domain